MERLDAVEIKVTLSGDRAERAEKALGLSGTPAHRGVWFAEDLHGPDALPLLDAGVILRVRRDDDGDDVTVKLRPCLPGQLTDEWMAFTKGDKHKFRVEADWSGDRKVVAASLVAPRDAERLDDVLAGRETPRTLFSDKHRQLLADCARLPVELDAVTVLGPVRVRKWDTVKWEDFEVDAERWVLEPLDFLELSIRVDVPDAEAAQARFTDALRRHGADGDPVQETKTRLVLQQLAAGHHAG